MPEPQADPLADYLRTVRTNDTVRAQAWDAVTSATSDADLTQRLQRVPVPNEVRAQLFDLYQPPAAERPPDFKMEVVGAREPFDAKQLLNPMLRPGVEMLTGALKGAAGTVYNTGRYVGNRLMPGDPIPEVPASLKPDGTMETIGHIAEQGAEFLAPSGLVRKGVTAAATYGPKIATAAKVGLEALSAGGIATAQGGNPLTAAATGALVPAAGALVERAAPALREAANAKVVQALGPTKERFKAMAARLTPGILKRGLSGSRQAILEQATQKADEAGDAIDGAIQQFGSRQAGTQPIVDALETAKDAFRTATKMPIADAVKRGVAERARDLGNGLVEVDVVFEPRAVAQLDGLKTIVSELGDTATVDQLINIRRAWDKVVDQAGGFAHRAGGAIGVPLSDQTEAWAKREATGAIRKVLAAEVPELTALNKEFAFWKGLKDVLTQTQQRTQPQGPGLLKQVAEAGGAAAASSHGIGAAVLTGKLAKAAQAAFTSPRWRLLDARVRNGLADAIESGSVSRMTGQLARVSAALASKAPPLPSVADAH